MTDIKAHILPADVAARAVALGHDPLVEVPGNYEPTFECPRCRGLALGGPEWTGWAVEYDCERVQLVTGEGS